MRHGMHRGRGFGMGWGGGHGGHGGHRSEMETELAAALGISVDALRAAQDTAYGNMIEKAVAEGELAPKEAERMQTARKLRGYVNPVALMAQVLEISPQEMQAALDAGRTPWDLAAERNLDLGAAWQKLMAAGKATLDQAVADGVVTRKQADELFSRRGRGFFGKRGFGPGFMGRGGDCFGGPPAVI